VTLSFTLDVKNHGGVSPGGLADRGTVRRWFLVGPGVSVPAARVKELVQAGRATA
jgi:hypothetical protein